MPTNAADLYSFARRRIVSHRQDVACPGLGVEMQLDTTRIELTQHVLDSPAGRGIVRAVAGDILLDDRPQGRWRQ
jgi:hypothetical protein